MEIQKRILASGAVRWRVRWRQGGRYRSQTFDRKGDAVTFGAELRRRQQLGTLTSMDMGRVTLGEYVLDTWCEAYASQLSPKTWMHYRQLLNKHILPSLGPYELRSIRPETIARWQAERLAPGHGRVSVRYALTLLGAILQRAFESGLIQSNPARAVRKASLPRRTEVRPLAPATIERMRAASSPRDATLISVLAYAGLRPGEALALQWRDIREQTVLVERAISLGEEKDTKTAAHRTVCPQLPRSAGPNPPPSARVHQGCIRLTPAVISCPPVSITKARICRDLVDSTGHERTMICLTSRRSAVRDRHRPPERKLCYRAPQLVERLLGLHQPPVRRYCRMRSQ